MTTDEAPTTLHELAALAGGFPFWARPWRFADTCVHVRGRASVVAPWHRRGSWDPLVGDVYTLSGALVGTKLPINGSEARVWVPHHPVDSSSH